MPEVFVDLILEGRSKIELKGLLNSGARDVELVLPRSVAGRLGVRKKGRCEVFYGRKRFADVGSVKTLIKDPESGESRGATLDCIILPDEEIDCVILGTVAHEKLRVIPDTVAGKPIFK